MRKGSYFLKAAVAVLAAALLAKLLRDRRFSRSGEAGSDTPDGRHRQQKETRTVEGDERRSQEERQEGITEHDDELRVQRTEEELAAGTREREAGEVRVRKNVRSDRESIEVPTRHEEVSVERVPVEGEASEAEIGEDEVSVPVTEEEVVVSKRPVVKEEVRIKKDVVDDTEVVEEDVRREEIDIEDETSSRRDI
jgi:uncharacterized protein (TIGR02271 family)